MKNVVIEHISKGYKKGNAAALTDISLEVEQGELFGLIGPDGAGKTTLFRILTTLLLADKGRAFVLGNDVTKDYKNIRRHIGYMPGKFSLYQDLTVEENLQFFATLFNTTIAESFDLIRDIYVQIEPFKKRPAGKLSGGMKQKLALCCALIHKPSVLFLDEPTTGVDTVSRKEFWQMLRQLKQQGITILVSTPYMDEATLCERIALMQDGKLLSVNTPQAIVADFGEPLYAIRASGMSKLLNTLRKVPVVKSCFAFGENHHITFQNNETTDAPVLWNALQQSGITDATMQTIEPGIEDCFIKLMK